jgi:hypothetical protein
MREAGEVTLSTEHERAPCAGNSRRRFPFAHRYLIGSALSNPSMPLNPTCSSASCVLERQLVALSQPDACAYIVILKASDG